MIKDLELSLDPLFIKINFIFLWSLDLCIFFNNKGILVSPEGNSLEFLIKKSELAINAEETRNYNRFQIGDRVDVAISELVYEKRKAALSVKLLEKNLNVVPL